MNTLTKTGADSLRAAAQAAKRQVAQGHMELCRVLWETYYACVEVRGKLVEVHELWGYGSWADYVETELDLHWQTASAYRRVHDVFEVDLEGFYDRTKVVGITKMRILTRAGLTKRNVAGWLNKAAKMSCCELEHAVSGHDYSYTISLTLSEKDKFAVEDALERAKKFYGITSRGEALAQLIRDWAPRNRKSSKGRKAS